MDAPKPEPTKGPMIKLALLLDTSNSMDGLINQARSRLWNVVNEIGKAEAERKRISAEIESNAKLREYYIAEAQKKAANSGTALDDALISALREQAKAVGFSFRD
ncbi:hypothetical protein N9Q19_01085 [Puniceicoccaceae bacterium]|nr:hypothetical protein [Puniceicoccaceae bacterium]